MKKLTQGYVEKEIEKCGHKLLSKYVNNRSKLDILCPEGHKYSTNYMIFRDLRSVYKCPICANNNRAKSRRHTIEEVRKDIESEGYTLLSTEYKNNKEKIYFKCKKGHVYATTYYRWKYRGVRCSICSGKASKPYKDIKKSFERENYILLTNNYTGCDQILEYICSKGHYNKTKWGSWNTNNRRCPTCSSINRSGENHYNWKGGISSEPYCPIWSDKDYKESIKQRDNYICQNPYCYKTTDRLVIHHIDYDKKNCHPSNLITVCNSCNSRANIDREWHKEWYQIIVKKKN